MTSPSSGNPADLAWPDDRPELLPFLPLVYVAWSDGVLTGAELEALCLQVEAQLWLDEDARHEIRAWLHPEQPPSASSLERIRDRIRSLGDEMENTHELGTLTELGLRLAEAAGAGDGPWSSADTRKALRDAERGLGVVGDEAVRELLVGDEPTAVEATPPSAEAIPFEVEKLRAVLDAPDAEIRKRVLSLLRDPLFRFRPGLDLTAYREGVLHAVQRLADEGLGGLAFPREHGGAGDPSAAIAAFESLAFGDLSVLVKYGVQFGLFGGSVYQLGTQEHHERYLRPIARLELPGCYAMTETGHGSNVRDLETTARYDPETDEFVIHTPTERARKDWIGNAALHGHTATVFAQLEVDGEEHGVHAFLVPLRAEDGTVLSGIDVEDCGWKEGLNGVDNGRLRFDRVRIPRENLLDRFGRVTAAGEYQSPIPGPGRRFFTMLGTLVAGRISIAAASVSVAKTGLTIAVRYSARRRQFGPAGEAEVPILDYRVHQRLLLPRLAATYGLHFAVRDLVSRYERCLQGEDGELDRRMLEADAAGLKAVASSHAVDTLQACREACGGQGYLAANRFGTLKADTDVFTTFEGANPVLLQLVARSLLARFQDEMGDLKLWGLVRHLAERAQTRVSELNPVQTRRTDEEHLLDPEFHRSAFAYREERLLTSAARRLKTLLDEGVDSFEAMNTCQDHLVTLARAHVERWVLEAFHDAMDRSSPEVAEPLRTLARLHALARLEEHRGWYLESGYFEPAKAKAVRARVNRLCSEVAELAPYLVDAFGIPDDVLAAPAGLERGL